MGTISRKRGRVRLAWWMLFCWSMMPLTCQFTVIQGGLKGMQPPMSTRKSTEGNSRSKFTRNISYQKLALQESTERAGTECAVPEAVSSKRSLDNPIVPISNLPPDKYDGGMPDKRDFAVMRYQDRVRMLERDQKILLAKLSRCLAILQEQDRYIDVGLRYDQWESYNELAQRQARIRGAISMIIDVNAEPTILEEQAKQLKEKLKI